MTLGTTIRPVMLDGFLGPARRTKVNQYEFYCHDQISIGVKLPLTSGNPYRVTASPIPGQRNKGLQVTCKFKHYTVLGQFHRHTGREGIWLSSDFTNRRSDATEEWHKFVSHFGIKVNVQNKTIPVYLDFYNNPMDIVIRLKRATSKRIA